MSKAKIHFFTEDITYTLKKKTAIKDWLKHAVTAEGYVLEELNFIFCSDEYLLRINQEYLQHDDYTDVITFDNSEQPKTIAGDVFISIERIRENAKGLKVSAHDELCRVIIHGTLHLLGYKDKDKAAKRQMTAREDHYLSLLQNP
ncbi:rRNA maturation RNase YbeY [Pedobacter africanus]|uniref:Endoribonuclease YbeY n=1 Tax=Pedobacter africanus TaxID=151894 RepID=A0A1W2B8W8_9SPHI|nr:rRNA maturation RNase YbeY [Pedobacter africanus]SMC69427.1 rRNA maturation RNase YbeY [Pedobacter africanus]